MICHPLPPKKDHWFVVLSKQMVRLILNWLKNPFGILKFLAGYLALAAFCMVLLGIVLDYRAFTNDEAKLTSFSDKRLKYNFECSPQISESGFKLISEASEPKSVPIELRYFLLREAARKRTEPYHFSAKLNRFALCASPTKLGFGGVEIAHSASSNFNDSQIAPDIAQIRANDFERLVALYDDFPNEIAAEAQCLLSNLSKKRETMGEYVNCADETVPAETLIIPKNDGTYEVSDFNVLAKDVHAIVAGADREDEPAIHQVELTRFILENNNTEIFARKGWLRTVSFYPTKKAADDALEEKKNALPFGGYVVRVTSYCKNIQATGVRSVKGIRIWSCEN